MIIYAVSDACPPGASSSDPYGIGRQNFPGFQIATQVIMVSARWIVRNAGSASTIPDEVVGAGTVFSSTVDCIVAELWFR